MKDILILIKNGMNFAHYYPVTNYLLSIRKFTFLLFISIPFIGVLLSSFCRADPTKEYIAILPILSGEKSVAGLQRLLIGGYELAFVNKLVPKDLTSENPYMPLASHTLNKLTALFFSSVYEDTLPIYPHQIKASHPRIKYYTPTLEGQRPYINYYSDATDQSEISIQKFDISFFNGINFNFVATFSRLQSAFKKKYSELSNESLFLQIAFSELNDLVSELKRRPPELKVGKNREDINKAQRTADQQFAAKYGSDLNQSVRMMPELQSLYNQDWKRMYQRALFTENELPAPMSEDMLRELRLQNLQTRFHRIIRNFITSYYKEIYKDLTLSVWKKIDAKGTREKIFQGDITELLNQYPQNISGYNSKTEKFFITTEIYLGDTNLDFYVDHKDHFKNIDKISPQSLETFTYWKLSLRDLNKTFPYEGDFNNVNLIDGLLFKKKLLQASHKEFISVTEILSNFLFIPKYFNLIANDRFILAQNGEWINFNFLRNRLNPEKLAQSIFLNWFEATFPNESITNKDRYLKLTGFSVFRLFAIDKMSTEDFERNESLAEHQKSDSIWEIWEHPNFLNKIVNFQESKLHNSKMQKPVNNKNKSSTRIENKPNQNYNHNKFTLSSLMDLENDFTQDNKTEHFFKDFNSELNTSSSQFSENQSSAPDQSQKKEIIFSATNNNGGEQNYIAGNVQEADSTDGFLFSSSNFKKNDIIVEQSLPVRPINNIILLISPIYHEIESLELTTIQGEVLSSNQYSIRSFKNGGGYYLKINDLNFKNSDFVLRAGYRRQKIVNLDLRLTNLEGNKFQSLEPYFQELGLLKLSQKIKNWEHKKINLELLVDDLMSVLEYVKINPTKPNRKISEDNPFLSIAGYINARGGLSGVCREHNKLLELLLKQYYNEDSNVKIKARKSILLYGKKTIFYSTDDFHVITEITANNDRIYLDATSKYERSLARSFIFNEPHSLKFEEFLRGAKSLFAQLKDALTPSENIRKYKKKLNLNRNDGVPTPLEGDEKKNNIDIHSNSSQLTADQNSDQINNQSTENFADTLPDSQLKDLEAKPTAPLSIHFAPPPEPPIDIKDAEFLKLVSQLGDLVQANQNYYLKNRFLIKQIGASKHPAAFFSYAIVVFHLYLYNDRNLQTTVKRLKELTGFQSEIEINRENFIPWLTQAIQKLEDPLDNFNKKSLKLMNKKGYQLNPIDILALQMQPLTKQFLDIINFPIMKKHYLIGEAIRRFEAVSVDNKEVKALLPEYRKHQKNQERIEQLNLAIQQMNLSGSGDFTRFKPPTSNNSLKCESYFKF